MSVFGSLGSMIGQIIEGVGSVVGYRRGTEEPAYSAQKLSDAVEIRTYGARIAAQTTVTADEEAARSMGFRRLAGYIFGANHVREKIAMTAPVAQQSAGAQRTRSGAKIPMSAPVAQESAGEGQWVIRFFMPSAKTMDTLPEPDDDQISLVTVPEQHIAVRRFSGSPARREVAAQTAKLLNTLREFGFEPTDAPAAWFYDPPWTIPALRRNEIAVPVSASA